jgi:large repetitive protein
MEQKMISETLRTDSKAAAPYRRRSVVRDALRRGAGASVVATSIVASLVIVTADPSVPTVVAAGTPDIVVTKSAASEALIGSTTSVTLTACNPTGQPDGFNLSFRDVVPAGLSFAAATPAPSTIIANQPAAGQTTLIWLNVSDLLAGACSSVSYSLDTNPDNNLGTTPVGTTVGTTGGAYVNSNAFNIPDFDSAGQPTTDITGSDTDGPTSTLITAFITEKDAGNNGEGELTRGVHGANPKVYTLRVRNNPDTPTNDFDVVDVLPPTLEFLGCVDYTATGYDAGTDNTVDAPTNETAGLQTDEYPGSGRMSIGASAATCREPSSIETLVDGSTRVTWSQASLGSAGDLAANGVLEITYLAGIPMRANTNTWPNGKPSDAGLGQGRNLDNNSGSPTSETASELGVTNTVTASGAYQGPSTSGPNPRLSDSTTATVTAEDLLIRKGSSGQVIQGSVVTHTLTIETGEYRDATNLKVTDTLPDGMCPLSTPQVIGEDCGTGSVPQISVNGGVAVDAPYTSAVENADGTWTLIWDQTTIPGLAALAHDGTITITFTSRVRRFYQQNGADETTRPVLNFDSMTNNVALEAPDFRRATIDPTTGDPEADGQLDFDVSSASITGVGPTIDKRVSEKTGALANGAGLSASTVGDVCQAGTGITWRDGVPGGDGAATGFGPGDFVCFDLRAFFPANVDGAGVKITDLLPASYELVAGSARRVTTGATPDTLTGTTLVETNAVSGASDAVVFTVASTGGLVPSSPTGQTFHWTVAARLLDPNLGAANDINANLMKMTTRNSGGSVFQFRDESSAVWTEPQVKLDKSNNALSPRPIASTVDFSIKVWNDGNVAAQNAEVWDRLPSGIACSDVSLIVPVSGVCSSGVIRWPASAVPSVAANTTLGTAPVELTYRVTVPNGVDPGRTYTNTAGVRRYEAVSNASDTPFVYFPSSNIDSTVVPNTGPASDTSSFTTPAVTHDKVQQSSVSDSPRNPANSPAGTGSETATIGETITYTITATIPEGTTVIDPRFADVLDADLVLDATPTWVFNGVANDAAWTLTAPAVGTNGTIQLDRSGTYTNAPGSGNDLLVVTIVARVSNAAGTTAGDTFPNTAAFSWLPDTAIGTTRVTVNSNTTTGTVREPVPTIVKNENDADDIVNPNDTLTYTLNVNNNTVGTSTRLHEAVVVDTIPAGLTVVNAGVPVVDGGSVDPDLGIWNATARTITWNATTTPSKLTSIAGGATTSLTYSVVVDDPATSGSIFTNSVTVTGSSLAGTPTGERTTYTASTTDTVTAPLASVAKSVNPTTATIGDTVTYTVDATIPAGITAFDTTLLDTMPDGVDFRAYGSIAYTGVSTGCPSLVTTGATGLTNQTANADGSTTVGFWLGDITAPAGNSCVIRITYTARIDNTYVPEGTNVVTNQNLVNSARLYWNGANTVATPPANPPAPGSFTRNSSVATATVGVREPLVRIDKDVSQSGCDQTAGNTADADTCATDVGSSYTYTLTITNAGNWPAYDVSVSDTPDSDLVNINVPASSGTVTVVDGAAPGLEWLIPGPIAASSSVTITYTADLAASSLLNDGEQIVNTADVPTYFGASSTTRTADSSAEWRIYGQGGAGGDVTADTVTMTVGFPNVTVVKSAISDATDARAGVPFTWRIRATNQTAEPTAPAYNVDLDDTLPSGWVYTANSATITTPYGTVSGVSANPTCSPSCATPGAVLTWSNVVSGSGQPLAPGAQVTIDFQATPQSSLLTVGTTGTFDHVNTAGVDAEDVTGATGNADGPFGGPDDTEPARIRRIDLSVTKAVSAGPYAFGSEVNWTVTVNNAGPDTATNVTVGDVLDPAELVFVQVVSSTQGSYSSSTGVWTVGSVPNGTTHTLVIRTRLNKIGSITNRAWVRSNDQWDVDSTPSTNAPTVDEDDDDSVTITSVSTSLGDYVWYDIDGDSTVDAGEPGIPGVRMVLESAGLDGNFGTADDFFGPDGLLGNGDDITVTETTTNGTGFYGFSNLPTGQYRVRVDPTTLPAGMTPTFNDDAPNLVDPDLDHRSGVITLTSSTGYLAADFGYTGTGSLGDTVWLDLDNSGGAAQQGGEPGIRNVDVTLVWGGFDGDLSTTADNITYPIDITDPNGQYLFERLPAGPYRVTLDAADLPAGTTPTYDLDGTGTANATTTSLTAGQNRTNVDFSVAGTGSIGDRVWYDADGDGSQDAGETGLGGIDVTVTWLGPDGVPGGDDVVFTTTTAADGTYLVDHLPAGSYTVVVDTADLPQGVAPTFDLDGTGTPDAVATTLTPGQDRRDVDFGYRGIASVGDRVWFDLDGDGSPTLEAGDVGLGGVTVAVRWAGPDGIFDNADDVVRTTTTDATGTYLVDNLPYGPVRVTVDPTQLPGFEPTFDGDGLGTANQVILTLAPDDTGTAGLDEANPRTADFAYTGTGSIGDLVWEDADANGARNGTEPGLPGVTVTVTWGGLDGVIGTADDVSFPATTGPNGEYLVDRLPAGTYTVVVDTSTVPVGMVIVSELDPTKDSRTTVTLTPGQDRTDVDFGYQRQADLSIDKSHTGDFEIGRNGTYTIVVRNLGPSAAVTPTVSDVLPNGLGYVSGSSATSGVSCSASGQTVTCTLPTMALNDSISISLVVSVGRAAAPGVTNTATVTSPTFDPVPGNNTDSDPTVIPLADLAITKQLQGSLVNGSIVDYLLVATNLGPSPSGGPITITDPLPAGLVFVEAGGTGVTCSAVGQTVTCITSAAVAVGQSVTVTVRVRVAAAVGQTIVNTATVEGPIVGSIPVVADPIPANNSDGVPGTVTSPTLPTTGATVYRWILGAMWSIAGGFLLLLLARRRRQRPNPAA